MERHIIPTTTAFHSGKDSKPKGDAIPPGTFHSGKDSKPKGDAIPPGTFHSGKDSKPKGDAIPPGTFHSGKDSKPKGDAIPPGTFHSGEDSKPKGDAIPPGTFHSGKDSKPKGDAIPPGTFHVGMIYYRTKDGLEDYKFSIERQSDGTYRAYILYQPSYGLRDTGLHATHRLSAESGRIDGARYRVCWLPEPRSEDDLKKVISYWADLTQVYIRTGRSIDAQHEANLAAR